jgi:hypothetical protein
MKLQKKSKELKERNQEDNLQKGKEFWSNSIMGIKIRLEKLDC